MASIYVWNQKYRQGWRQRAKAKDVEVEKRKAAEFEEWKSETNGGVIRDVATGRMVACKRDRWEREIRNKWLDERDARARKQSEKAVMTRMEQEEDAKKSPEERLHEKFERKNVEAMRIISDGHKNCLFCGFRFGMSEAEAYSLIDREEGQTGGGGRIWQYGMLKKPFRLFDRIQLCFFHGRLCSFKLLTTKTLTMQMSRGMRFRW